MSADPLNELKALVESAISIAAGDAAFRAELRKLAQAILEATEETNPSHGQVAAVALLNELPLPTLVEGAAQADLVPLTAEEPQSPVSPADLVPLTAEESPAPISPSVLVPSTAEEPQAPAFFPSSSTTDDDLPIIESRCRLKAEACRWAAERQRLLRKGANFKSQIEPADAEIIDRAKNSQNCYLWMCNPKSVIPPDLSAFDDLAGCFDALASALALMRGIMTDLDPDRSEDVLKLLAEAQSSVRAGSEVVHGPTDNDQKQVYDWLRCKTAEHQIYLERFMRKEDRADPAAWPDLQARITELTNNLQDARERAKKQKKLFGKLRHKVKLISTGTNPDENWKDIAVRVGELVEAGVPPSNTVLRNLLLPVIDDVPEIENMSQGFFLFLREIERYRESRPSSFDEVVVQEPTAEVREAARLLNGRSAVIIGGRRPPHAYEALKTALGLKDLIWIETLEQLSLASFEPHVSRPDVVVVLFAIRWVRHGYGDVKKLCAKHGKPFVRLPAGYNPNQVAAQIMAQCSERLRAG